MSEIKGYIYILTNPSFPQYVKIGYADDVQNRVETLNRSSAVPFAFRIYASYGVSHELSDKLLHSLIDTLDPDIRSIETFKGKTRMREFYKMSAEQAYSLLEAIAKISGTDDRLVKYKATQAEIKNETEAEEDRVRKPAFDFFKYGIPEGAEIEYVHDKTIKAKVVDAKHIKYEDEVTSVSSLAQRLLHRNSSVQGTLHFSYEGKKLVDIANDFEEQVNEQD